MEGDAKKGGQSRLRSYLAPRGTVPLFRFPETAVKADDVIWAGSAYASGGRGTDEHGRARTDAKRLRAWGRA